MLVILAMHQILQLSCNYDVTTSEVVGAFASSDLYELDD